MRIVPAMRADLTRATLGEGIPTMGADSTRATLAEVGPWIHSLHYASLGSKVYFPYGFRFSNEQDRKLRV